MHVIFVDDRLLRLNLVDFRARAAGVHLQGDHVALDEMPQRLGGNPLQLQLLLIGLKVGPEFVFDRQQDCDYHLLDGLRVAHLVYRELGHAVGDGEARGAIEVLVNHHVDQLIGNFLHFCYEMCLCAGCDRKKSGERLGKSLRA